MELGVGANRLSVVSYGKEQPFCNERSESLLPAESSRACGGPFEITVPIMDDVT